MRLLAAVAVLWLVLVQPNNPGGLTLAGLLVLPLELPPLILALVLAPRRIARPLRLGVTLFLTGMVLLRLADLGAYVAYVRPFNPVLDMALVPAALRMLGGAVGPVLTAVAAAALVLALGLVVALLWWATGRLSRLSRPRSAGVILVAAVLLPLLDLAGPIDPPGEARAARIALDHGRAALAARGDLDRFRAEAAADPFAAAQGRLLGSLAGVDILVIFVESFGRSALGNPLYRPTIAGTLAVAQTDLAARGLASRSGWLTAPMVGGQSWLAHASLLSGLRIDSEGRYRALMASDRQTFARFAQASGWQSVAVMPAIVYDWPEAAYFGYDRILDADALDYRGKPFNWVTMPDQFTLSSFERQVLADHPRPPVLAEIALISSHAPWTPIPPLLPWDAVGDGRVFDAAATSGDPPDIVWRDKDRVRDQYRLALDYALRTVMAFVARRAPHPTLAIVLGDHQPSAFVSGDPTGRDVPLQIIGAPELLARLDGWDLAPGLIPDAGTPVWPMEAFRDRFLAAFTPS